jgi:phosphoribosylglycinamide formyltransferase-1
MKIKRIALFASGNGSNAIKILEYFKGNASIEVAVLVTNNSNAGVLERTAAYPLPRVVLDKENVKSGVFLIELMKEHQVDFIVLSGYLKLIPVDLVQAFQDKIINIHPALLPKFGGTGMYGQHVHKAVKDAQESESGITIHLVNEVYDKGRIIAQHKVNIVAEDSIAAIQQKVQMLEHKWFAREIENYILQYNAQV